MDVQFVFLRNKMSIQESIQSEISVSLSQNKNYCVKLEKGIGYQ